MIEFQVEQSFPANERMNGGALGAAFARVQAGETISLPITEEWSLKRLRGQLYQHASRQRTYVNTSVRDNRLFVKLSAPASEEAAS